MLQNWFHPRSPERTGLGPGSKTKTIWSCLVTLLPCVWTFYFPLLLLLLFSASLLPVLFTSHLLPCSLPPTYPYIPSCPPPRFIWLPVSSTSCPFYTFFWLLYSLPPNTISFSPRNSPHSNPSCSILLLKKWLGCWSQASLLAAHIWFHFL